MLPEPCIGHFLSIFSYSHLLDWVRKLKLIGHIKGELKYIPIDSVLKGRSGSI